jgi:CRP/FNR family transcriptional regulator, cyclic AMP receptor protein
VDKKRLKEIPLFAELSDDDLDVISAFGEEKSFGEGEVLVREGDFSYELMVIEEGSAAVERGGDSVAELGPGDFFGEAGVVSNQMRAATVRATSSMRVLALTTFDFKRMRKMPGVMEAVESAISARATN